MRLQTPQAPTLIVGLGGTGAQVIAKLRRRLQERYDDLPVMSLLAIDEDGTAAPEAPAVYAIQADTLVTFGSWPPIDDVGDNFSRESIAAIVARPERLYRISPLQFEAFVAEVYRAHGFQVWRTRQSHDDGVDLVVEKTIAGMRQRFFVQCKHSSRPNTALGVRAIRELKGVLASYAATAAVIVTNARFTNAALRFLNRCAYRVFGFDVTRLVALARNCVIRTT